MRTFKAAREGRLFLVVETRRFSGGAVAGVIVKRFAGVGVPSEARLAGVIGRTDVTIYAFHQPPLGPKETNAWTLTSHPYKFLRYAQDFACGLRRPQYGSTSG